MLRSLPANSAHGDAFNFAPLREIWKQRLCEVASARRSLSGHSHCGQQSFRVSLDVIFADAAAGSSALHFVDINAHLAGEAPDVRRSWNGLAVFSACHLAKLRRHIEGR